MTDIVERLREAHPNSAQRFAGSNILIDAADEIDRLRAALRDIAEERGGCSKCGKLADMPSNCVSCDNYRGCTWEPQNPANIARTALDAKERKE